MSKVRLTATIACFQIRKKMVEKASRLLSVYIYICNFAFLPNSARNFLVCKQQRRRSASAPAQFYQLSLESMIAKPATCKKKKIKFLSDMRARIQTILTGGGGGGEGGGGGGGGGQGFSRELRTSFSFRKQMATYDFHGEVRTPCPLCLRLGPNKHTGSEVSAHIRIHISFIFFAGSGQFTKRLLIISADAKGKDSMILFKIKETAHINSGHVLF